MGSHKSKDGTPFEGSVPDPSFRLGSATPGKKLIHAWAQLRVGSACDSPKFVTAWGRLRLTNPFRIVWAIAQSTLHSRWQWGRSGKQRCIWREALMDHSSLTVGLWSRLYFRAYPDSWRPFSTDRYGRGDCWKPPCLVIWRSRIMTSDAPAIPTPSFSPSACVRRPRGASGRVRGRIALRRSRRRQPD